MKKSTLCITASLMMLIALIASVPSSFAASAELLVGAADKTVAIAPNTVAAIGSNVATVTPGANGIHVYSMQASIGDAGPIASQGHLRVLHTEMRATLLETGTVIGIVQIPLQYELVGDTLYATFRYRLKSVGAGPGSDVGSEGPFDVINTVISGHTADSVQFSATFGVQNTDGAASHSAVIGVNLLEVPF